MPVAALTSRTCPSLTDRLAPPPQPASGAAARSAAPRYFSDSRIVFPCRSGSRSRVPGSHQQVLAGVVATEDDVVDLADVGEFRSASVRDRALHVFAHLAQRLGELALDRLEDALALDVLVLALVEVRGRSVVLLVELAVDLDRPAGRFLVAGEERADHHHAGAKAHALGDVA